MTAAGKLSRRRRVLFAVLALTLSLGFVLVASELAVRLLAPPELWRFRDSTEDWTFDSRLGWVQKPNLRARTRNDAGTVIDFRTNPDGLTPLSARRAKTPGVYRILLLGDSTVVGRSVPQDQTLQAFLETRLQAAGRRVEVFNGGVEGYSTDQVLLRLEQLVPLYRPDVVFYGLCDNDLGGNSLDSAYGLPKPRFVLGVSGVLELQPLRGANRLQESPVGVRSSLQRLAVYRLLHPWLTGLRANLGGWEERNLLGLAPEWYYNPESLEKVDWDLLAALLVRMREDSARDGARFLFYSHPALAEVWRPFIEDTVRRLGLPPGRYNPRALEERLEEVARRAGVPYVPLIDAFEGRQGPFHLLPRDPHCNPAGYRIIAGRLGEAVEGFLR